MTEQESIGVSINRYNRFVGKIRCRNTGKPGNPFGFLLCMAGMTCKDVDLPVKVFLYGHGNLLCKGLVVDGSKDHISINDMFF